MKPEQRADLRDSFQSRHGGAGNAGSTLVLDGGMTWKAAQISPEDAELLETRKFGVIELCRLFQVPPTIVQAYENHTFTNPHPIGSPSGRDRVCKYVLISRGLVLFK